MGRTALARAALHTKPVAWGCGLATLTELPFAALERAVAEEAPGGAVAVTDDGRAAEVAAWVTGRLEGRALMVDDLHLAHAATAEVLRRLAGTVPLVVTIETDHRRAAALRGQVALWPGLHAVEVTPLDHDSAVRLVQRHACMLDTREAERLAGATGGAPGRLIAAASEAAAWARSVPSPAPAQSSQLGLSPRQTEVLELIAGGSKTTQIARRLGIAESTVESHVRAIRSKLGAPTRTAAVAWAS